jgi:hypothetical protein
MITLTDIQTRFPGAFDAVTEGQASLVIDEAAREIVEDVWGDSYDDGILYLSAHLLTLFVVSQGVGGGGGPVSSRQVGDVSVTFATARSASEIASGQFGSTLFGQRFLQLRRWFQGGPSVPLGNSSVVS